MRGKEATKCYFIHGLVSSSDLKVSGTLLYVVSCDSRIKNPLLGLIRMETAGFYIEREEIPQRSIQKLIEELPK